MSKEVPIRSSHSDASKHTSTDRWILRKVITREFMPISRFGLLQWRHNAGRIANHTRIESAVLNCPRRDDHMSDRIIGRISMPTKSSNFSWSQTNAWHGYMLGQAKMLGTDPTCVLGSCQPIQQGYVRLITDVGRMAVPADISQHRQ
jgi:hypothetical protein